MLHKQSGLAPIAIILIIAGVLVLGGGAYFWQKYKIAAPVQTACTQEAKICSDGTSVGRTGPNCEFVACPSSNSTSTSSINTSSWKTYHNEEYGFEIKYPNDWKVEDGKSFYSMPFVIFRFKPGCMFTVEVLSKEHVDYNEVERFKKEGREWKSIIIGNISGTMFEWEMVTSPPIDVNSLQTSIYFNKENNLYRIIRTVKEEGKWSECVDVSDQILSTFKFISPKPTASIPNWKTYSNYGFEVQYPPLLKVWENPSTPESYLYSVSFENPLASQSTPGQKIVFNVSIFKNNNQLQDAFKTLILEDQGKVTVAGYEAKKLFAAKGVAVQSTDATIYTIALKNTALIFYGSDYSEISKNDISKILYTFKFIK